MKEDRQFLALLWGIYGALVIAAIVGATAETIVVAARSGINQEWLGFAGALLGSIMTVAAGILAWLAAQRTISANQAMAERRERDTFRVIQDELGPRVRMLLAHHSEGIGKQG
ncbi:MAG: hypothetical protein WA418_01245 [Bradyrhizobium sp.]